LALTGLHPAEANALTYRGRVHNNLGQREEALKDLNDALTIWHAVGNAQGGTKMLSLKDKLRDLGQLKALKDLNDALPPNLQKAGGSTGEANTLDNLGETYSGMGQGRRRSSTLTRRSRSGGRRESTAARR